MISYKNERNNCFAGRRSLIVVDNTQLSYSLFRLHGKDNVFNISKLVRFYYNISTTYSQKLWKIATGPLLLKATVLLICAFVMVACTLAKAVKNKTSKTAAKVVVDNSLVSLSEDEVRKKLGDPTSVSRMADNRILWTYTSSWKFMPDNAGTTYVEFENGKATRIIRVR